MDWAKRRKAASALISYALYTGVGLSAVYLVVSTGMPYIENAQDTAAINQHINDLSALESQITDVAQMGQGSQTTHTVRIDRGSMNLENETLFYEIRTGSGIITAGSRQQYGPVTLSANAQSSLTNSTDQGTPCYKLRNDHIETCIRKYGTSSSFESGSLDQLLLYLKNHRIGETTTPTLDLELDTDATTATGKLRTTPVTSGENLGTAHLAVLVKPDNHASYTVHIKLRSGADFLEVNTE